MAYTFGEKYSKMTPDSDIPGTRRAIETAATTIHISGLAILALLGGVILIVGFVWGGKELIESAPDPMVLIIIGAFSFSLFLPWFMTLYFARHLLISIKRLEGDLEAARNNKNTEQDAPSNGG